jgi:hypothetical protein
LRGPGDQEQVGGPVTILDLLQELRFDRNVTDPVLVSFIIVVCHAPLGTSVFDVKVEQLNPDLRLLDWFPTL